MKSVKYTIVLFLLCITNISCIEKSSTNDSSSYSFKGKVKNVKEEFYFAENKFEKITPIHLFYTRMYKFSYKGSILEREIVNNYPANINDTLQHSFIREEYNYTNDVCIVNSYTSDSSLISYQEIVNWNNKPLQKSVYCGKSDKLLSKINYKYNSNRQLETCNIFYPNKNYEQRIDYKIGKKTETYNYKFENLVYRYDVYNKLVEMESYSGQKLISTTYFSYNRHGDVILKKNVDSDTKLIKETSYSYIYDKYNNWTTAVERRSDGNIFLKKRFFTYYHEII